MIRILLDYGYPMAGKFGQIMLTADQIFGDVFSDEFMKGTLHDGLAYPATQSTLQIIAYLTPVMILCFTSHHSALLDVLELSPTKSKKARTSTSDDDRKVIKWLCDILKDREGYKTFTENQSKSLQNPDTVIQGAFITKFSSQYHRSECSEANGKIVTKAHLGKALMIGVSTLTQADKGHSQLLRFIQAGSPSFNEEVKKELEEI
ncbi:hypothetical protein C8J56DRAFT_1029988 [Mycena floridula]|nr:hypothetical protein C8J56DRAFT_1029988 [Mycena floridula]